MSLKTEIESLASQFAAGVLAALRNASLEELLDGGAARSVERPAGKVHGSNPVVVAAKTKGGRLARRSAADIAQVTARIVAKLAEHKMGLRSEQLQKALKLTKQEIAGPIAGGLAAKKIVKTGEKRATVYFAR